MSSRGAPAQLSCRTLATIWAVALAALFLHPVHAQQNMTIRTFTTSNKCIDIPNNNQVVGQVLQQWTCNGSPAQLFTRTYVDSQFFKLRTSGGRCVTAGQPHTQNPTAELRLTLQPCYAGYWSQEFRHANFALTPRTSSSLCVDINGASSSDGAAVQLWGCNTSPAQRFDFLFPAGMSGYNVMSADNTAVGALPEYSVTQQFVNNINVVAVHEKDWATNKYAVLEITFNGRTGQFQVWDFCRNSDCNNCCDRNMQGTGVLLDIDSTAAKRVFNIDNAENSLLARAHWRRVGTINPATVCTQQGTTACRPWQTVLA